MTEVASIGQAQEISSGWFEQSPSDATVKQEERKQASTQAGKPKRARKPKQEVAPVEPVLPVKIIAPKRVVNGQVRYADAQSAARTTPGFVPNRSTNYALAARTHIHALLKTAAGKKVVADVNALMASLISSGSVPKEYAHLPHVRYWRKQVVEQGK